MQFSTLTIALFALCAGNVLAFPVAQESTPAPDCSANETPAECQQSTESLKAQYAEQCEGQMWAQVYPPTPEEQACIDLDKRIKAREAGSQ